MNGKQKINQLINLNKLTSGLQMLENKKD